MLEQYIILQLFKTFMWRRFFENVVFHGNNIGGNYSQRKTNEETLMLLGISDILSNKAPQTYIWNAPLHLSFQSNW